MHKILVIGSPGSGKSTFAIELSEITQIPVTHLDNLFWRANKTTVEREEFLQRLEPVLLEDTWIINGNYGSSMSIRLQHSDTVIFLDYDVETCLEGVRNRVGKVRPDIPWVEEELDLEFYEYVRTFPTEHRPEILDNLAEHSDQRIITLKNRAEGDAFLRELKKNGHYKDTGSKAAARTKDDQDSR